MQLTQSRFGKTSLGINAKTHAMRREQMQLSLPRI